MGSEEEGGDLQKLLERASQVHMTAAEKEEQRRSFAYGNTRIENEYITREMVDRVAEEMAHPDELYARKE